MPIHDFRSQRLFIDDDLSTEARLTCSPDQANYLRNVLRLGAGDRILVFNGREGEWIASVHPSRKRDCELVIETLARAQSDGPDVRYLFAPLKRARLDYMAQKATEMGVATLEPVLTAHTIAARVNIARLKANVVEAAEQCGVLRVPDVCAPMKLEAMLRAWPEDRVLVLADEAAAVESPINALSKIESGRPIGVIVGPEGGFSDNERRLLHSLPQTLTVSLGPRIMRADTAAVAVLALVNATLGDWVT